MVKAYITYHRLISYSLYLIGRYDFDNSYSFLQICPTMNPVVLFIVRYKVVLTFESVDEILKCDHSSELYWAVVSCGAVYCVVQGGSNVWVCGWNPKMWPFKWTLLSRTFLWNCLLCCTRHFNFLIFGWNVKCQHLSVMVLMVFQCFPLIEI